MATKIKAYGAAYDASSVSTELGNSLTIEGFEDLEYEESLEPGHYRGNSPKKTLRSRGEHDASGSFKLPKFIGQQLIRGLGDGYGVTAFPIVVIYQESDEQDKDELIGCRITNIKDAPTIGDVAMQEFTIDIMEILRDGLSMSGKDK